MNTARRAAAPRQPDRGAGESRRGSPTRVWLVVSAMLLVASCACAVPADRVLFADDFDSASAATPYWWQALDGDWVLAQRATRVLRQSSEDVTSDSWDLAYWANYAVVTKCLGDEGDGPWGLGLTAYDDTQGRNYRLRLGEGRLYLEKVNGAEVRVLQDVEAKAARGKWYSLRLSLTTRPESTILLGKVWGSDEDEPKDWLIRCEDNNAPYQGGSIGVWSGNCPGRFLYLAAKQYDLEADKSGDLIYGTDFSDAGQGRLPVFWTSRGGLWLRDTQPDKQAALRQVREAGEALYDENASACLQWTGYTVSARAIAHPGPTKWGFGLIGYYGSDGSNYRLRSLDNRVYLVKRRPDGRVENLASVTLALKRGEWYNLKLALDNLRDGVRLQAKVWPDETEEPGEWQATAYDRQNVLTSGAPGVWCFGSPVDFDDFQVKTSTLSALNDTLQ